MSDVERALARDVERLAEAARPALEQIGVALLRVGEAGRPILDEIGRAVERLAEVTRRG